MLYLNAIMRGIIAGQIYTQPMFAYDQSFFFTNSTDLSIAKPFISFALSELGVFYGVGILARFIIFKYPNLYSHIIKTGLLTWVFGLIMLMVKPRNEISLLYIQTISYLMLDFGGGLFFWGTFDDVFTSTTVYQNSLIGYFSYLYIVMNYWTFVEIAALYPGSYLNIYAVIFTLSIPFISMITVSNCNQQSLILSKFTFTFSICLHFVFILVFNFLIQIPSLCLYLHRDYSKSESELLLFSRCVGIIIGEFLFYMITSNIKNCCFGTMEYVIVCSLLSPFLFIIWIYNINTISIIIPLSFFQGITTGGLFGWTYYFLLKDLNSINIIMLLYSICNFPGNMSANYILYYNEDSENIVHRQSILILGVWISIATLFVILFQYFSQSY